MKYTDNKARVTATLKPDMLVRMTYWADKHRVSVNQYLADAIAKFVMFESADHTKPTKETERLNFCVKSIDDLGQSVMGLQKSVDTGFDEIGRASCRERV